MISYKNVISLCITLTTITYANQLHIGLCIMATGKYLPYAERLIDSARRFFFIDDKVTYFVFTDGALTNPADDIISIYQARLGWPYDTLKRCEIYNKSSQLLEKCDYLYACDADMLFVAPVGREMIGERVATQHPGYISIRHQSNSKIRITSKGGAWEDKRHSTACVLPHERKWYYAGGFFGGSSKEFLKLCSTITARIQMDWDLHKYIACWHDESHINRYFIDYQPTLVLNSSYCYPENWNLSGLPKKLLALDKNHQEMRS